MQWNLVPREFQEMCCFSYIAVGSVDNRKREMNIDSKDMQILTHKFTNMK